MIESYVDLTYRGLSLGRRIRLTQIRPNTCYVELPAPMPVGTQIAIATDDGATFEATVVWVHEQVAGSDRAPGMVVAPELTAAPAAAWWTARVTLSDDDPPRLRATTAGTRSRPVTVRPRSRTTPTPPPVGPTADAPAIAADLAARVAAAAGLPPPRPAEDGARTLVVPALAESAHVVDAEPGAGLQRAGDHDVIDDGNPTTIMESIDPATLGFDLGGNGGAASDPAGAGPAATADHAAPAGQAASDDNDGDNLDGDDDLDDIDPGDTLPDGAHGSASGRRRKSRR